MWSEMWSEARWGQETAQRELQPLRLVRHLKTHATMWSDVVRNVVNNVVQDVVKNVVVV